MPKVTIEFEVEQAQELASTAKIQVKRIAWVLENNPPTKKGAAEDLVTRLEQLTKATTAIDAALNQRALANAKVVKIGAKR
jgi:hypothetical protein